MNKLATCIMFGAIMLACMCPAYSDDMASFATGGYATGLRNMAMMHKIDANHDHMISRDEWISFQNKMFAMLDKNNTGKVDQTEYMRGYPALASFATGGYASGLLSREMFDKIDANHDGTISRDEFIDYQLKIFDMMDTSTAHKGMLGPAEFFATGGKPAS